MLAEVMAAEMRRAHAAGKTPPSCLKAYGHSLQRAISTHRSVVTPMPRREAGGGMTILAPHIRRCGECIRIAISELKNSDLGRQLQAIRNRGDKAEIERAIDEFNAQYPAHRVA
jgi:hypothetical protein